MLAPDRSGALADVVVLDAARDADEYARVLYARLREADARGVDVVLAVAAADDGRASALRSPTGSGAPRGR